MKREIESYKSHELSIIKAVEFLEAELKEAFKKDMDSFVVQEVYSLSKAIRLLQDAEGQIRTIRHLIKAQD